MNDADKRSAKGDSPSDKQKDDIQTAPWKALFFFTTRSHLTCLSIGIISAILAGVAAPAQALLIGKAFAAFTTSTPTTELLRKETEYVSYMVGVATGGWLLHFIFFSSWVAFGELQAKSARDRLFKGLLERDIEWYDMRKNGIGALISRLQAQVRELQIATAQPLGSFLILFAEAIFNIGLALFFSWKLTLVIISTTPLIAFIVGFLGVRMQDCVKEQQEILTQALQRVSSALKSIETVKCFNGQDHELQEYAKTIDQAASWYYRVVNINAQQFGFTTFMASAMFVQGFYYGGVLVSDGQKNAGDVITTSIAAIGAFSAIAGILPQMIVLEKGRTAGATLRAVMAHMLTGTTASLVRNLREPDTCDGDISFKNVSFAYPSRPDQLALSNVNLIISGGTTTFIIGKSGSGKSTIGQLLMRFYSPITGDIQLDGFPISSLDPGWLRSRITLVEQNSVLFEDTIFFNIALGKKDFQRVSRPEVIRAAEFALLQQMINDMPDGLDTVVGAKGGTLSGGQRQRMALARAYIRDSPVLLLDESTSALDHVSRSLVIGAVRQWRHEKTTVIITHDISLVSPDDYVLIIENGHIVLEGHRKDMESLRDSPFKRFLPEEDRAQISPKDLRRYSSQQYPEARSVKSVRLPPGGLPTPNDPIEQHLKAGESPRMSYVPTLFTNKQTSAALHGAYKFGAVNTHRFVSHNTSQPPSPISTTSSSPSSPLEDDAKPSPGDRRSTTLDAFLIKTGTLAARARLESSTRRTRRLQSDASPTTPVYGDSIAMRPLHLESANTEQAAPPPPETIRTILATIWPAIDWVTRIMMILGFFTSGISAAITPAFSFILSKLLQTYGTGAAGKHEALVYSMTILGLAFVSGVCTYLTHMLLEYAGQRWIDHIRMKAMENVLDQPRDFSIHEENSIARITESLDRHAEEMRNLLGRFAAAIFSVCVTVSVTLVWAMVTQWTMTLIALSLAPYVYFTTKAFGAVSGAWETRSNDAAEIASAVFTETFTSIRTVRALTLEQHFTIKYLQATKDALAVGMQRALYTGIFYGLSDSSSTFITALIFYIGARLVKDGANADKIVEVFIQLIITIANVSNVLAFVPQISSSIDTASRLLRLSRLPQSSHEHAGNTHITSIGDISITNLTFAYPSAPSRPVLQNLTLHLPAGTSTALVGTSGSGKSTIASLLLNLYTPTSTPPLPTARTHSATVPAISLSGRDMAHIHTPSLRNLIAIVPQTPTLFPATVAKNITYGLAASSPYLHPTSIRAAAASAGIDDFVMSLPQGYGTVLGDGGGGGGGVELSGGQAQRVAIARALVRRPRVLILDESTSALDVESAGLIRETVGKLVEEGRGEGGRGLTVLIITHDERFMRVAERVVMLDQGRVVEAGGYEELVARRGKFYGLVSGGVWTGAEEEGERKGSSAVEGLAGTVNWGGHAGGPTRGHSSKGKGKGRMI